MKGSLGKEGKAEGPGLPRAAEQRGESSPLDEDEGRLVGAPGSAEVVKEEEEEEEKASAWHGSGPMRPRRWRQGAGEHEAPAAPAMGAEQC